MEERGVVLVALHDMRDLDGIRLGECKGLFHLFHLLRLGPLGRRGAGPGSTGFPCEPIIQQPMVVINSQSGRIFPKKFGMKNPKSTVYGAIFAIQ